MASWYVFTVLDSFIPSKQSFCICFKSRLWSLIKFSFIKFHSLVKSTSNPKLYVEAINSDNLSVLSNLQLGMASALETLCGQSYGAKQYDMLGVHLQRSWIVLFLSAFFLVPISIFTTPILEALGQEENIAQVAGVISLWTIPVIFAFVLSFTCQMYLQAQSKNMIIAYLSAFSIAIHILLSWLLTVKYKLGIPGAMVSTILAFWIPNVGQLLFVVCGGCPETWKGFSMLAFKDLWDVVKLSLSSGVMLW